MGSGLSLASVFSFFPSSIFFQLSDSIKNGRGVGAGRGQGAGAPRGANGCTSRCHAPRARPRHRSHCALHISYTPTTIAHEGATLLTRGKTPRKRLRTPPDLLKGRHVETPSQCCEKAGLLTTRANLYSPCPTLLTDVVGAAASSTCMRVLMTSIGVVGTAATAAAAAATTMEVSGRREGLGAVPWPAWWRTAMHALRRSKSTQ